MTVRPSRLLELVAVGRVVEEEGEVGPQVQRVADGVGVDHRRPPPKS